MHQIMINKNEQQIKLYVTNWTNFIYKQIFR